MNIFTHNTEKIGITIMTKIFECPLGNEINVADDADNWPDLIDDMMVYHEDEKPKGLFPECKTCSRGKHETYAKFDLNGTYIGMGKVIICILRKKE